MEQKYPLIVFDWDGTLMDSAGTIAACIQAACVDLGIDPPDERTARHVIGLGLHDALSAAVPGVPESQYQLIAERYRYHYLAQDNGLLLFPGAYEMVVELSEARHFLGVATGKSRHGLKRSLGVSGLESFFHATRCADECPSKPAPNMLLELMDELGVTPEQTLMIGDTTHDLLMAKNAGVASLGVSYGAHPRDVLEEAQPLALFEELHQLKAWLKQNG